MKILLMISPESLSGACLSGITLAKCLKKNGVEVVLVVKKKTQQILKNEGIDCHVIMPTRGWTVSLKYSRIKRCLYGVIAKVWNIIPYRQILRIVKRENPDIVHMDVATGYLAAKAAVKCEKRLIWHIRELIEEGFNCRWFNQKKALQLMSRADCLISISNCVYNTFHALLPQTPNRVIYNGVDMDYYKNEEHQIFSKEATVFTIAGQIAEHKGQLEALMGLTCILKERDDVEFWIAGKGNQSEIDKIRLYIKEKEIPETKVKFLGFVNDMASVWGKTDVAVVASRCEAFGRVTVEAMASGCLILGTNTGGTDELIEDGVTGIKYQQGDPDSMATRAAYILANKPQMQKIAAAGRTYAINTFTAEQNAKQIKELYERILSDQK